MSQFQYFSTHAKSARLFNEGMTSRGGHENDSILAAYDFARFATVVDIGGGEGGLLAAIFESTENTRGILFDLPHVVATARMKFAGTPQAERPAFGEGDFFEGVPAGADAYVLKKVIHNWDDERALSILKRCAAAMSRDARLLLIEPLM